uniref:Methyltransferase domain-containing protein n=1 Tax=Chrysotila carterae TaxID=13221 RepID=A0A7S4EW30_CHRCT
MVRSFASAGLFTRTQMAGSTSLRSICRTHGVTLQAFQTSQRHVFYKVATTDPYLSIASQPESITTGLAAALELNAASDGQRQLREALLGRLKGHVLEVGTGTGAVAREVAKMEAVQAVTGIDPSPAFLERARSLGGPKEKYVEAYSTDLSSAVETASVDHALMWTTCGSETLTAPPSVLACGVSLAERVQGESAKLRGLEWCWWCW